MKRSQIGHGGPRGQVRESPQNQSAEDQNRAADENTDAEQFLSGIVFSHGGNGDFFMKEHLLRIAAQYGEPSHIVHGKREDSFYEKNHPVECQQKKSRRVQRQDDAGGDMDLHRKIHTLFSQGLEVQNDTGDGQRQETYDQQIMKHSHPPRVF